MKFFFRSRRGDLSCPCEFRFRAFFFLHIFDAGTGKRKPRDIVAALIDGDEVSYLFFLFFGSGRRARSVNVFFFFACRFRTWGD